MMKPFSRIGNVFSMIIIFVTKTVDHTPLIDLEEVVVSYANRLFRCNLRDHADVFLAGFSLVQSV